MLSFEYCKLFKNSLFYRPHSEVVFPSSTKNNLQNSSLELLSLWQCIYFCTSLNINFLSQEIFSGRIDVTSHKVNFRLDTREAVFWKKSGHLEFAWLLKQFGATKPWWLSNSGKQCPSASNRTSVRALSCLLSCAFCICFEAEPTA